jgi:hypothetical protein
VRKEKETFKKAIQEFLQENIASTSNAQLGYDVIVYDMPHPYDHTREDHPSEKVINIRNFLVSCLKLLNGQTSIQELQSLLEKCNPEEEMKLEKKIVNHVHRKTRTNREFRLNTNIVYFNMGDIILDLGYEVNVLPKKTWECIGEPTLGYSPIQLKLANQHRVIPIGRLKCTPMDLDGVFTMEYFEVIDIVDNTTPYRTLFRLD